MRFWGSLSVLIMGASISAGCSDQDLRLKSNQQSESTYDSANLRVKNGCASGAQSSAESDQEEEDSDTEMESSSEEGTESEGLNLRSRNSGEKKQGYAIEKANKKGSKKNKKAKCESSGSPSPSTPVTPPTPAPTTPTPTTPAPSTAAAEQYYNATLKPALTANCGSCHSVSLTKADTFAKASAEAKSGKLLSVSRGTGHPGGNRCGSGMGTPCAEISAFTSLLP